uniref:Uncharacterized protein n=1 Tax=Arundo donax TaxID=35708 RepID=A0A0A9C9U3_ARUDO
MHGPTHPKSKQTHISWILYFQLHGGQLILIQTTKQTEYTFGKRAVGPHHIHSNDAHKMQQH